MAATTDPSFGSGRKSVLFTGDLYEGDSFKPLFTLPPGTIVTDAWLVSWAKSSNATTAYVGVGAQGTGGYEFLPFYDVKANGAAIGSNPIKLTPTFQGLGAIASNAVVGGGSAASRAFGSNTVTVVGTYAATGGTAGGGPVTVVFETITV